MLRAPLIDDLQPISTFKFQKSTLNQIFCTWLKYVQEALWENNHKIFKNVGMPLNTWKQLQTNVQVIRTKFVFSMWHTTEGGIGWPRPTLCTYLYRSNTYLWCYIYYFNSNLLSWYLQDTDYASRSSAFDLNICDQWEPQVNTALCASFQSWVVTYILR